jgi:hypothetical protein
LEFGDGFYTPTWYGFSIKAKVGAEVTGRFEYNQYWWYGYAAEGYPLNETRDVNSSAALGVRTKIELILSWGHDWNLGWAGHWGLGAEASVGFGPWITAGVTMTSSNIKDEADFLAVNGTFSVYVEIPGAVWIGQTEHKNKDDDIFDPESHKLVAGARALIVFKGTAGLGIGYKCTEYDWYNDKWNNDMRHNAQIYNGTANGKFVAQGEFRWNRVVFQNGYLIWEGSKKNDGIHSKSGTWNDHNLDLLL